METLSSLYLQSQDGFHRIIVLVIVKKFKPMLKAKGCNKHIDGLADRNTLLSQHPEILCRFDGCFSADKVIILKRNHHFLSNLELLVVSKALQKFGNDQITGNDPVLLQFSIKNIGLRSNHSIHIVNR